MVKKQPPKPVIGFHPNPIAEHAGVTELVNLAGRWRDAEEACREAARRNLEAGCRSHVLAEAVGMSRATFYRWLAG